MTIITACQEKTSMVSPDCPDAGDANGYD